MSLDIIGTIAGAIFGSQLLTALVQGWFSKNKTSADAASTLVETTLKWQNTLMDRIASLEKILQEKDTIIEELRVRVTHLEMEVGSFQK